MIDSTNPRVIADNIRHLTKRAQGDETVIAANTTAIEDLQIYDDAETDTGMKWIDGKPIYRIVFEGTSPSEGNVDFPLSYETIVNLYGFYVISAGATNYITRSANLFGNQGTAIRLSTASASSYQGVDCYIIVEYTKPDPEAVSLTSPAPDDTRSIESEEIPEDEYIEPEVREEDPIEEPVVEVKKTTRKKSTN